jgi:apolipoprotein N-acyltransferase
VRAARRVDAPGGSRGNMTRSCRSDLALAALSGLLVVACFPRFDADWLVWVALVPLLLALERATPMRAMLLGQLTGVIFFVGVFEWIWQVPAYNMLDEAMLGLYLALYFAFWALGFRWLGDRLAVPAALVAPALWVSMEYLRGHAGFLSLPWMLLGHSQYRHPVMLQITSLTGVYGVSFVIVLVNVAIAQLILRRPTTWRTVPGSAVAALASVAVVLAQGAMVLLGASPGERLAVAAIQGNVPQNVKWDAAHRETTLQRYAELTREAARHHPALIAWPETALPGDVEHDPRLLRPVRELAMEVGIPLLVGSAEHAKFTKREYGSRTYNSMVLVTPEGRIAGAYRKIRLVPFGEYVPLQGVFTWPAAVASSMGDSVAGEMPTVFRIGDVGVASTICWENIFPDLVRQFVRHGARIVVNATNEAWFQDSGAPRQFLAISVFRAAEHRVSVLRVANTGISALIDPYGRIVQRLRSPEGRDVFVAGVLAASVPVSRATTPYTAYGDVFAVGLLMGCGLLAVAVGTRSVTWWLARRKLSSFPYDKAPVV